LRVHSGVTSGDLFVSAARLPPNRGKQLFLWMEGRGLVVAMDELRKAVSQAWHRDYPTYDFIYTTLEQTASGCAAHFTRYVMGGDYSPRQEELDLTFSYAEQPRYRFFDHEHITGFCRNSAADIDPREFESRQSSNQSMKLTAPLR
jgi:hypothetical protein